METVVILSCATRSFATKPDQTPHIKGHISPSVDATFQAGNRRNIGSLDFFVPLLQSDSSLFFFDARLMKDSKSNKEGNLGFIYRRQIGESTVVGGGSFLDRRRSSTRNIFNQLTLNAHFLTPTWQVQGNVYLPENKQKISQKEVTLNNQVVPLQGYLAGRVGQNTVTMERALKGVDLNVTYALKTLPNLRFGASVFRFRAKGFKTIQGVGQNIQCRVNDFVAFQVEHNRDAVRKSNFYAGVTLTIPLSATPKPQKPSQVDQLFITKVIRDIDAVTAQNLVKIETMENISTIFVNPAAPPGGNGTVEHPFQTGAEAENFKNIEEFKEYQILIISSGRYAYFRRPREEEEIRKEPAPTPPPPPPPVEEKKKAPARNPKPKKPPVVPPAPVKDNPEKGAEQQLNELLLGKTEKDNLPLRRKITRVGESPTDGSPVVGVRKVRIKDNFNLITKEEEPKKEKEVVKLSAFAELKKSMAEKLKNINFNMSSENASALNQERIVKRTKEQAEADRLVTEAKQVELQAEMDRRLAEFERQKAAGLITSTPGGPPPPPPPPPLGLVIKTKKDDKVVAEEEQKKAAQMRADNKKAADTAKPRIDPAHANALQKAIEAQKKKQEAGGSLVFEPKKTALKETTPETQSLFAKLKRSRTMGFREDRLNGGTLENLLKEQTSQMNVKSLEELKVQLAMRKKAKKSIP